MDPAAFELDYFITGCKMAFVSFLGWCLLTPLISLLSMASKSYTNMNPGQQKEWCFRVNAFLHSVVASIGATYVLCTAFPSEFSIAYEAPEQARFVAAISCGYFAWDGLTILMNLNTKGTNYFESFGLLHGFTCFGVYFVTLRPYGLWCTLLCLIFEYSSPLLNIRWFLIKTDMANNNFAFCNDYLFVLTFFVCRILLGPYVSYQYLTTLIATPYHYGHICLLPVMFTSNFLNYYWFVEIIRGAMVASPSAKRAKNKEFAAKKKAKQNNKQK